MKDDLCSLRLPCVVSPINIFVFRAYLRESLQRDANWVLQGLSQGFAIGVSEGQPVSAKRNCVSAYQKLEVINAYIKEEIRYGTIAGPFDNPPIDNLVINRFGVIPKSTPGKWRLITDLSYPLRGSVNDLISDAQAEVH